MIRTWYYFPLCPPLEDVRRRASFVLVCKRVPTPGLPAGIISRTASTAVLVLRSRPVFLRSALLATGLLIGFGLLLSGCIPYAVGTTARPAPEDEAITSGLFYTIPNGLDPFAEDEERSGDETAAFSGLDGEVRYGIDERSDFGVRIPGASGVVVNYKRLLTPSTERNAPAVAAMAGGGFVNAGQHLHLEGTLIASSRADAALTPYGGLRAMQVIPLSASAPSDSPTLGGFLGVRIGNERLGISPEVGVYYDRSALDLRRSDVIAVLAISVHGRDLLSFPF